MKTNLYKITYPSGLVDYVHDGALLPEDLIRQMSGFTPEEAAEHGLIVELAEEAHEENDPVDPPVTNEHGQPPLDPDGPGPEPTEAVPPPFARSRFQNVP